MDKKSLIDNLKTHKLTCGWDMVCCYRQDTLNKMLAAEYTSGRLSLEIPIDEKITSRYTHETISCKGSITLKAPTICFTDDGKCDVIMYVKSGRLTIRCNDEESEEAIFAEDSFWVSGTVPLSALSSSTKVVDATLTAESPAMAGIQTHSAGTVITFDGSAQGCKMYVYLDFSNMDSGSEFTLKCAENCPLNDDAVLFERVKTIINYYFRKEVNSLRYILGGISSIPTQYEKSVNLYPKSCLFCTQHNAAAGYSLNIYMQISDSLDGSGSYSGHIGSSKPQFPDNDVAIFPLPDQSTSMIAISQTLLFELYIKKTCEALGWKAEIDSSFESKGLKFLFKNPAKTIKKEDVDTSGYGGNTRSSSKLTGIDINFESAPLNLVFEDNAGKFSWTHTSKISYTDSMGNHGDTSATVHEEYREGKFDYKISCDKPGSLSAVGKDQVGMFFSVNKDDFKLSAENIEAKRKTWDFLFVAPVPISHDDKEYAQFVIGKIDAAVKKVLPSFTFDFGELNLFFAANLLFPGKHVFGIDSQDAYGFPSDMMVFGSIKLGALKK